MTQESTTRRSAILSLSMTAAGVVVSGCPPLRGPSTSSSPDPGGPQGPAPVQGCEETGPRTDHPELLP
jgi:hypothetical protein